MTKAELFSCVAFYSKLWLHSKFQYLSKKMWCYNFIWRAEAGAHITLWERQWFCKKYPNWKCTKFKPDLYLSNEPRFTDLPCLTFVWNSFRLANIEHHFKYRHHVETSSWDRIATLVDREGNGLCYSFCLMWLEKYIDLNNKPSQTNCIFHYHWYHNGLFSCPPQFKTIGCLKHCDVTWM